MKLRIKYIFTELKNMSCFVYLFSTICMILFALDFMLYRHGNHPLESIPGFYAFYGFIGCVLLVIIAKWLRAVLMRPENYYHKTESKIKVPYNNSEAENVDL
ncbi:hypothetical protein [Pseudoalteromonas sp. NBT06-2]|uniref:hypothetical protein n=1 Tax=Pseudoalteromonas sp. NBT06-2 TaxID=2025950 RepID=UPI0020754169|nr:hypothetical protein [Pseudoalteromonas sp. NBT06-2]